jgi:hypothetical protein
VTLRLTAAGGRLHACRRNLVALPGTDLGLREQMIATVDPAAKQMARYVVMKTSLAVRPTRLPERGPPPQGWARARS